MLLTKIWLISTNSSVSVGMGLAICATYYNQNEGTQSKIVRSQEEPVVVFFTAVGFLWTTKIALEGMLRRLIGIYTPKICASLLGPSCVPSRRSHWHLVQTIKAMPLGLLTLSTGPRSSAAQQFCTDRQSQYEDFRGTGTDRRKN